MAMGLRRSQHELCIKTISAACFILLFVISLSALHAPPLVEHPAFPRPVRRSRQSQILLQEAIGQLKKNALLDESFQFPIAKEDLWSSEMAKDFYGCSNASRKFQEIEAIAEPDRYLMIVTSGGLNQQRTGITDAVVAARILNATLVVPTLDKNSFWKDESNFTEIFDVDHFISSLSKDIKIVKVLPEIRGEVVSKPTKIRVPRKCDELCYEDKVLPALKKKNVVQLTKFDYRLSNLLATDLQKLRCRANYHALRFTDQIQEMGELLVQRMRAKSKHFIALHLRYEADMLAFSGCYYGGGDAERQELGTIRKRWKNLHTKNPEIERKHGKCPLTPEEAGLMLRALGFSKDDHIYVASGEIYGGEKTLAPLKALFPNFHSKDTLASEEELAPFSSFSSRMAALDYIVCDGSDVFVTNNNGNMAKMLAGRRRYFGHKRTIRPNAKKLSSLFLNRTQMTWDKFALRVRSVQTGFMGEPNEVKPGGGVFHENPDSCICEKTPGSGSVITAVADNSSMFGAEELGCRESDYRENLPTEESLPHRTESDDDLLLRAEDHLDDMLLISD